MRLIDIISIDDREKYAKYLQIKIMSILFGIYIFVTTIMLFLHMTKPGDIFRNSLGMAANFIDLAYLSISSIIACIIVIDGFNGNKPLYNMCFDVANQKYLENMKVAKTTNPK